MADGDKRAHGDPKRFVESLLKSANGNLTHIGVGDVMPHCKAITNVDVKDSGRVWAQLPSHVFFSIHNPTEIEDIRAYGGQLANGDDLSKTNRGVPGGKGVAIWVDREMYDPDKTDLPAAVFAKQQVDAMAASLSQHLKIPLTGSVFEHPLTDNPENPTPIALVLSTDAEHAAQLGRVTKELHQHFSRLRGKWHRENPNHINDDRGPRRTDLGGDDTPGSGDRGR